MTSKNKITSQAEAKNNAKPKHKYESHIVYRELRIYDHEDVIKGNLAKYKMQHIDTTTNEIFQEDDIDCKSHSDILFYGVKGFDYFLQLENSDRKGYDLLFQIVNNLNPYGESFINIDEVSEKLNMPEVEILKRIARFVDDEIISSGSSIENILNFRIDEEVAAAPLVIDKTIGVEPPPVPQDILAAIESANKPDKKKAYVIDTESGKIVGACLVQDEIASKYAVVFPEDIPEIKKLSENNKKAADLFHEMVMFMRQANTVSISKRRMSKVLRLPTSETEKILNVLIENGLISNRHTTVYDLNNNLTE